MMAAAVTALVIIGLYTIGWVLGGALASWWEARR